MDAKNQKNGQNDLKNSHILKSGILQGRCISLFSSFFIRLFSLFNQKF
jgi:hypothetical protein